jgi:type III restriction enzyme
MPLDNRTRESTVAFHLEQSDVVAAYVKNEGMDFTIPYQWSGADHDYRPDYLIRLTDGTHVILEVKGYEDDQDRAKHTAAQQWAEAVTNWGEMGRWKFVVCKEPRKVRSLLAGLVAET